MREHHNIADRLEPVRDRFDALIGRLRSSRLTPERYDDAEAEMAAIAAEGRAIFRGGARADRSR